jgi:CheY-like chemotaxis protein
MNREVLEAFLSMENYRVSLAHNGKAGLQMIASEPPDLVIVDLHMPDMSGYDVCQQVRSAERTRSIPILIVTGYATPEEQQRGFEAGVNGFLTRPFGLAQFINQVRDLLNA